MRPAPQTAPETAAPAGLHLGKLAAPHQPEGLVLAVFYPAATAEGAARFGANAVFDGVEVVRNAAAAPGRHPVVLLSHGLGGNLRSLAWLAAGLAARGAIVAAVNHPGSTFGDFDMQRALDHGSRARDLSAALDWLEAAPQFAPHLDGSRVLAAGFSYGGWTALSLGGMRNALPGLAAFCAEHGEASTLSAAIRKDGARIAAADPQAFAASYRDPRVTGVFAVDPGLVWNLPAGAAADLDVPVTLIGLGEGPDRLLDSDFDRSGLLSLLPEAQTIRLAPAWHYSMMPACTAAGPAILEEAGEIAFCRDPEGSDRAAIHAAVLDAAAARLGL
ncbi:prolyl oligopeptidase family serine peptidase [Poseidonocella sp. HB161398]|uniref:alpha/beta hydrolase family protein n=1 Tax=Poseidonocella sp. HB161398 TaxID=2320855 RepID=UPI001109BBAD|nr:prolyl oligopeptidase family serine peptidase [Poseidonocella sp. HB161398]